MKFQPPEFQNLIQNHYEGYNKDLIRIHEQLSQLFFKEKTEIPNLYDHTIALSNLDFNNNCTGIIYPSVADKALGFNLALKPESVKEILQPQSISIYELHAIETRKLNLAKVAIGHFMNDKDKSIVWQKLATQKKIQLEY